MIDNKYLSEVIEFHDGDWIIWVGEDIRRGLWNKGGEMDFILDGKLHKVKYGGGFFASFFDSPDPDYLWPWVEDMHNMRKVDAKAILKELME